MSPQSLPAAVSSTVARAGLAAGFGGAGSLATLALMHKASAPAVAAGAVTGAFAVNAVASAFRHMSSAIDAVSNLLNTLIRARADAKATVINARIRAELARTGLDPGKTTQAAEMQRALTVNPDLPKDRRPSDETLIKLLGGTRTRSSNIESGTSPDAPGSSPRNSKATTGQVVPIRSEP